MNRDGVAPVTTLAALERPGAVPTWMRYPLTTPGGAVHRNVTELPSTLADRFVGDAGCAFADTLNTLKSTASPSAARMENRKAELAEFEYTQVEQNNLGIVSTGSVVMKRMTWGAGEQASVPTNGRDVLLSSAESDSKAFPRDGSGV